MKNQWGWAPPGLSQSNPEPRKVAPSLLILWLSQRTPTAQLRTGHSRDGWRELKTAAMRKIFEMPRTKQSLVGYHNAGAVAQLLPHLTLPCCCSCAILYRALRSAQTNVWEWASPESESWNQQLTCPRSMELLFFYSWYYAKCECFYQLQIKIRLNLRPQYACTCLPITYCAIYQHHGRNKLCCSWVFTEWPYI